MTTEATIRILLVEDNLADARLVEILLSEVKTPRFGITHVERLDEAIKHLNEAEFEIILLDLSLPDSSGLETVSRTRAAAPHTPMVVLSGQDDEEVALRALQSGVEDYLIKGRGSGDTLARIIRYSIERKNAQEALRRSEELYRTVVEQAAENIFIVDADTKRIVEANAAFHASLGYTPEELKRMTLYDIVAHDRESIDRNIVRIVQERHRPLAIGERQYRRKDGSLADVEVSTRAISYGGREAWCVVAHDVTERKRMENNLRHSLGVLLALYEAGQVLVSSLDLDETGPRFLGIMRRVADLAAAVIALRDERGELSVRYTVGPEEVWSLARETPEARVARQTVMDTKQPRSFPLDHSDSLPPAGLCLPLRVRDHSIGVLEAYGSEDLAERASVEVLSSFSTQVASALENARLYREVAEREHRLRDLVGQVLAAQEEERRRVSYEVHDGLAQTAAAAHQLLQAFARHYSPGSAEGRKHFDRALDLVQQTVGEARQVIADLRPTALDDFGLATAIRQQVERLDGTGRRIDYEETLGAERLPPVVETALYRVAQEALTNVQKHASSARARVTLQRLNGSVSLKVRDWGQGFNPDEVTGGDGPGERVGLSSMRERVALLGGRFEIRSRPGAGTEVVAEIPVSEERTEHEG